MKCMKLLKLILTLSYLNDCYKGKNVVYWKLKRVNERLFRFCFILPNHCTLKDTVLYTV